MHLYDNPRLYDALHTRGTAQELDGIERIVRRHLVAPGRVGPNPLHPNPARQAARTQTWLEPACGTGRFVRLAARRGHRVLGFDASPTMVAYARARLRALGLQRRARVFVADMARFADRLGAARVDVAFNLINSIRHLPTDAQMLAHLEQVAGVLRPRGLYAVGLSLTRYGVDEPAEDVWEAVRGPLHLQQWVQYLPPQPKPRAGDRTDRLRWGRDEQVISHVIARRGARIEHHDARWTLRCYDARQWRALVGRSPLRLVEVCDGHGDPVEDWNLPYVIFVLTPVAGAPCRGPRR